MSLLRTVRRICSQNCREYENFPKNERKKIGAPVFAIVIGQADENGKSRIELNFLLSRIKDVEFKGDGTMMDEQNAEQETVQTESASPTGPLNLDEINEIISEMRF